MSNIKSSAGNANEEASRLVVPSSSNRSNRHSRRRNLKRPRDAKDSALVNSSASRSLLVAGWRKAEKMVDDVDLSALPLGVLLGRLLLKSFKDDAGEEALFRGKVVSYLVPPTKASAGKLLPPTTRKRRFRPLDYGLYKIHFDDGDQCDMSPREAYECIMLYNQQRRTRTRRRLRICSNPVHPASSIDLLARENPPLDFDQRKTFGLELLLYSCRCGEYLESMGFDSPEVWALSFGWTLDLPAFVQQASRPVEVRKNQTNDPLKSEGGLGDLTKIGVEDSTAGVNTGTEGSDAAWSSINSRQRDVRDKAVGTSDRIGSDITGGREHSQGKCDSCVESSGNAMEKSDIQVKRQQCFVGSGSWKSDGERGPVDFELPRSSSDWISPREVTLSPPDPEEQNLSHTIVGAFADNPSTPSLPKRVLELPCSCNEMTSWPVAEHQLVLSVEPSYIPNAGRGVFVSYHGPRETWIAPGYVDLGKYTPHRPDDVKNQVSMEMKNFVFENKPSEWCFEGPPDNVCTLYGKEVNQNIIFDITSDETGLVHEMARSTLLPFVNEVWHDNPGGVKNLVGPVSQNRKTGGPFNQRLDVQNIDAAYHDDGSVHYLLRAGCALRRGEKTELLVHYGREYEGVRHRKYSSYRSWNVEATMDSYIVTGENNATEDLSALSSELSCDQVETSRSIDMDNASGGTKAMFTTVCPRCDQRGRRSLKKPKPGMCYQSIYTTIATYTETDLRNVLRFFLKTPPIPSLARKRMIWAVEKMCSYSADVLYLSKSASMPSDVSEMIERVLQLFPRGRESPYYEQDGAVNHAHRLLGFFIRKEIQGHGYCNGVVQEIVSPSAVANLGRHPARQDHNTRQRQFKNVQYRVSFSLLDEDRVMTERDVIECFFDHQHSRFHLPF